VASIRPVALGVRRSARSEPAQGVAALALRLVAPSAAAHAVRPDARTHSAAAALSQCGGDFWPTCPTSPSFVATRARRRDHARGALTSFYSNSPLRHHQLSGMMGQFVGDEVLALFGVPEDGDTVTLRALECARALLQIGQLGVQPLAAPARPGATPRAACTWASPWATSTSCSTGLSARPTSAWWATRSTCRRACCRGRVQRNGGGQHLLSEASRGRASRVQRDGTVEAKNVGLIKAWKFHGRSRFSTRGA